MEGSGTDPSVLKKAGIEKADLVIAVTDKDEVNIVVNMITEAIGKPNVLKIARIRSIG